MHGAGRVNLRVFLIKGMVKGNLRVFYIGEFLVGFRPEAAVHRFSLKKVFLKILQNWGNF